MRTLELQGPDAELRVAGIVDTTPGRVGVALHRMAGFARAQAVDISLLWLATNPSGGRIEVATDSTAVEVDLAVTRVTYGDVPAVPYAVDLVVDGEVVDGHVGEAGTVLHFASPEATTFDVRAGDPVTVRFDGLPPTASGVEVWLPHNASVELVAVRVDEGAAAAPPTRRRPRWVHYGSSISHCMEADRPTGVWPAAVARRHDLDLTNLAIAAHCHVDQFTARTIRDLDVDLVSLKLGINVVGGDTLRERAFVPAVHGFIDTVRDGHPDIPLVVVTPIVCPAVEDHPGPFAAGSDGIFRAAARTEADSAGSLSLSHLRRLLATVVEARRAAGDTALHLMDGLALFGPDDVADLPDELHPSPAGYLRMADRFAALAFADEGPFAPA